MNIFILLKNLTFKNTLSKSLWYNFSYTIFTLIFNLSVVNFAISKSDYGIYQQLFLVINYVSGIAIISSNVMGHFYGKIPQKSTLSLFLKLVFIFNLIITLTILISTPLFASFFDNNSFINLKYIFIGLIFFKPFNYFILSFLIYDNDEKKINYFTVIYIFLFVLGISFIYYGYISSIDIILSYILFIDVIVFLLFISLKFKYFFLKNEKNISYKKIYIYFKDLLIILFIANSSVIIDKFIFNYYISDKSDFASYQVGTFAIPFISIISGSIYSIITPKVSNLFHKKLIKELTLLIRNTTKITSLLLIPIIIFCSINSEFIIRFLFPQEYEYSIILFKINSLKYLGSILLITPLLNNIGLEKKVPLILIINLSISTLFCTILIPMYGGLGGVVSIVISTYIGYILPIYYITNTLKIRFFDILPLNDILTIILTSIVISYLFLLLRLDNVIISALIFYLFYFLIMRILKPKLIHEIKTFN